MNLPATAGSGAAVIAAQLREAIVSGTYAHGQRLPAERHLAMHFGASRTTVREALRQLEDQTLVTRRVGSGTFVNRPTAPVPDDAIVDVISPLELIEVRQVIEPHLARMAVVHGTARDLDRMAEALQQLESSDGDQERFSSADERFHLALAESADNRLMAWLYRHINEIRGHAQWGAMKRKILTPATIDLYNQQHRALYEAIRSRDVEAAVRMITEHLEKARRDLLGAEPQR